MASTPKREVAESSFDFLHYSIVDTFSSSTRTNPENDLDQIGFQIGQKLAERYAKDKAVFENDLAVITFLCKDFWTEVYGKQMDKLRTNHKGVFELQGPEGNASEAGKRYLVLPSAMIRGALAALGLDASVKAETSSLPSVVFLVHVHESTRTKR